VRRLIRESAGVSQAELAAVLDVRQTTLSRWETGSRRPRHGLLERYIAALDELRALDRGAG
jgi:transcriptional regulator with XRE-family HTH domain